jgi:lactate permease
MEPFLAIVPILLIFILMIGRNWSAAAAGTAGLAAAVAIAIIAFGDGTETHEDLSPVFATAGAFIEAMFLAGTVLWIIFPALCIFELQKRSGAFDTLKTGLSRLSDDRRITAILVAWFFALFIEGAAGFGTPVALAAPLLVSLGFAPVQAVALALIGHAAGVSFGAVGTPIFAQIAITGQEGLALASATALLHAMLAPILLVFLFRIAGEGAPAHDTRGAAWLGLAALCFLIPFFLIATFVGPELPTLGGALLGGMVFIAMLWRYSRGARIAAYAGERLDSTAIWRAAIPYLVLLVLILASRLITPLQQILREVIWDWTLFGKFSGSVQPLYHPGSILLLGFVLGGLMQGRSLPEIGVAAVHAARRVLPAMFALVAMLGLARIMLHAGMITNLAETAAAIFGPVWPLAAPAVGVLGSFITGSATASNILLTNFQETTARTLGLPTLQLAAAQGFGAAVGNIICPHNIIAGVATVGLHGREAEILRRTALACVCYAVAGGVLVSALIAFTTR